MGDVEVRADRLTAEAAQRAGKEKGVAAIAGRLASELYKVPIRAENIEDQEENITRFFVIAEKPADPCGQDKTSLLISVGDEPGALLRILGPFQNHRILWISDRVQAQCRAWEYHFIDLDGHASDPKIRKTLKDVQDCCLHLAVLGSYHARGFRLTGKTDNPTPGKGRVQFMIIVMKPAASNEHVADVIKRIEDNGLRCIVYRVVRNSPSSGVFPISPTSTA